MDNNQLKVVNDNLTVRFDPSIYAFSTNTIPKYLKIGDTFRGTDTRIAEWERILLSRLFPKQVYIKKEIEHSAKINEDIYFRDYSVHQYLTGIGKKSLADIDAELLKVYSEEFYKDVSIEDVENAIIDINDDAKNSNSNKKYKYYKTIDQNNADFHYCNDKEWGLRPNQKEVVENFLTKKQKKELLMYAVMRFGKSFTAMQCALQAGYSKVLIVSAKADVKNEWKKTVEMPVCFKEFSFICDDDLKAGRTLDSFLENKPKIAMFLTLQNLSGKAADGTNIKKRLDWIYDAYFDLIIIDETHYGAWADTYGNPIREEDSESVQSEKKEHEKLIEKTGQLKYNQKLHLSGTPYNLLYDEKFTDENIIATCQFKDILYEKQKWEIEHFEDIENGKENPETKRPYQEFDNPYFGFPKMLRFAFNLPQTTRDILMKSQKSGEKWTLNDLFKTNHSKDSVEVTFVNEAEVLCLLKIIDGKEENDEILSFLNVPKIKDNDICKHMVFVLPQKYSCDAMEQLLNNHKSDFINLGNYKVLNITGHTLKAELNDIEKVKAEIEGAEKAGIKTITLTVQKMLTGVTVKEWDTMIMLKNTKSAQEYDQAVFRIQNQYVVEKESDNGDVIKIDMKPQTILVDFDPMRMFEIQGLSARVVNEVQKENITLGKSIEEELEFFPIITYNAKNLVKVEPQNLVEIITKYNSEKSIIDEASKVKLDKSLLEDDEIKEFIKAQSKADLSNKLTTDAHTGPEGGFDAAGAGGQETNGDGNTSTGTSNNENDNKQDKDLEKKYRMCIACLSFYAFLSNSNIETLRDVLNSIHNDGSDKARNNRIFTNMHLSESFIEKHIEKSSRLTSLNINDTLRKANMLSQDKSLSPEERATNALNRFSRISDSEVVTPLKICREMLEAIGEDRLTGIVNNDGRILDIAGKTGEFAFSVYYLLKDKVDPEKLKNAIYTIPTSSVTYEFTRLIYEIIELNLDNIADKFTSYDLLKIKDDNDKVDYEKVCAILSQKRPLNEITINDEPTEGDEKVKFDVVVGNPPYQEGYTGESSGANSIYHEFIDLSQNIAPIAVMIHPARFLFRAGSTPDMWIEKILQQGNFSIKYYNANSNSVFPNLSAPITGGIAISAFDLYHPCKPIIDFSPYDQLRTIVEKVINCKSFISLSNMVLTSFAYHFTEQLHNDYPEVLSIMSKGHSNDLKSNVFEKLPHIFLSEKNENDGFNYCMIIGRANGKRAYRYVNREYINDVFNFEYFKLFLSKADGAAGQIGMPVPARIISEALIGEPFCGSTETFLSIGKFNTYQEAYYAQKYLKTQFARVLLGSLKVTQDLTPSKWKNVPAQDFTNNSDIDWSKSISEIDAQLYKKYNLTPEEIAFIESTIIPME